LQPVAGVDSDDIGTHEIILLFDISTSMGWNDTEVLAPDALKQIVGSLPPHWNVGLVTFNADVVDVVPPDVDTRETIHTILENVSYTSFTNSGTGLLQAAELFSNNAQSRTIIFFTDGSKVQLPTPEDTADAIYLAEQAIEQIMDSDIRVHVVAVGENYKGFHEKILDLAPVTGGHLFRDLPSEGLSEVASTLVFDALRVAGSYVGTADSAGHFTVQLPVAGLDSATVLITAESAIEHVAVNTGDSAIIQRGQHFALAEIIRPTDQTIHIEVISEGVSRANLIANWELQLMAEVGYGRLSRFWIADSTGQNVFLNPFFHEEFFPIYTETDESHIHLRDGYLYWDVEAEEARDVLQTQLQNFGINTLGSIEMLGSLQAPQTPADNIDEPTAASPTESPARPIGGALTALAAGIEGGSTVLIAGVIGLALVIAFLFTYLICFRPKRAKRKPVEQSKKSNFAFAGKLDLYVAIGSSDIDTPPWTFQLGKKREAPLKAILKKCGISNTFAGSDYIYFIADKHGSLRVENDSHRTVFVGSTALREKQSHTLNYGERVYVRSKDKSSVLVVSPRFLYQAGRS